MKNIEQENTKEVQQENILEGEVTVKRAQAIQLVQSKEVENEIAEIEKKYREIVERENNGSI